MARALRSSKKQPAFDPGELQDLIFSPAVGTGVGSHLLLPIKESPAPAEEGQSNIKRDLSSVAMSVFTTVAMSDEKGDDYPDLAIVGTIDGPTGVDKGTVAIADLATVPMSEIAVTPPNNAVLWITEHGDLVPQGRVKRIRLAQDVINSAEESVYDTLWEANNVQNDDRGYTSRVVQAGYDYLVKRTRLSKKTIQRIVAKLIDKDFIVIERPADIYQRTSTVYRVFSYRAVLDRHVQRGRSHVAKMGPGFSYVRAMQDPRSAAQSGEDPVTQPHQPDLTTVVATSMPTVVTTPLSTVVKQTRGTTTSIGKDVVANHASLTAAVYQALRNYGPVDDDILDRLIKNCKQQAPDCTADDIVHFIQEKGSLVRVKDRRIYSPIGFLLTAVPKCLYGEAFQLYREEQMKRREAEEASEARRQAELDEWRREQETRLADPSVPEEDKQFIREWLGIQ